MRIRRTDSAFYGADVVRVALTGGADVSITVRLDSKVKRRSQASTPGAWVSRAEVSYIAFSSKKQAERVTGRPVMRADPGRESRTEPGRWAKAHRL